VSPELYTKNPAFVTKIAKDKDASEDYTISKALFKLDPNENYGVYYRGVKKCKVTAADLASENIVADPDGKRCAQIMNRIGLEKFCALKMPRFDHDLSSKVPLLSKKDFLSFVRHIWACVAFLHHHKYIHGDIKLENMAYYKGHPVLFDWGWSFKLKPANIDKVFDEFSNDSYWAPILQEMPIMHPKDKLLYFNDIYMTARNVAKLLEERGDFKPLLAKHRLIVANESYYCERSIDEIMAFLFS